MPIEAVGVLWPDAYNYARFREICDDEVQDNIADFLRVAGAKVDQLIARGVSLQKVAFDPDELAAFARAQGSKVDSQIRATYAAFLIAERGRAKDGERDR